MQTDKLEELDFYFIREIKKGTGIYEKVYAKHIASAKKAHHVTAHNVCFWDNSGADHAYCVLRKDILGA